jgi:putative membrane protein
MICIADLPAVNAALNSLSALLLATGYLFIRRGQWRAHMRVMIAALVSSTLFLASYLVYHAHVGSKHFPGTGTARTVYLTILATHTLLAATVPFFAGFLVWNAYRRRFDRHKRIARWGLPIWLYVSVTGVVVYWMLYQVSWP